MKKMNHNTYPQKLKNKSEIELRFTISDCKETIQTNLENPNNSYYADEICYCINELQRRTA